MKKIFKGLLCAGLCGVLALGAAGESEILNPEVVSISYPGFFDSLRMIGG